MSRELRIDGGASYNTFNKKGIKPRAIRLDTFDKKEIKSSYFIMSLIVIYISHVLLFLLWFLN